MEENPTSLKLRVEVETTDTAEENSLHLLWIAEQPENSLIERITFAVSGLGKQKLILGHPWLWKHNPEIDWITEEVKMSRCPPWCCPVMRPHNPYCQKLTLYQLFSSNGTWPSKHHSSIFCTYPIPHHTYHSRPHHASVTHCNSKMRYGSEAFTAPDSVIILRPVNSLTLKKSHLA